MRVRCAAIVTFDADVEETDLYAAQRRLALDSLLGFVDILDRGDINVVAVDFMKIQEGSCSREPLLNVAPSPSQG